MEIERSFIVSNLEDIKKKLLSLEFKPKREYIQYNRYIDYPDLRLIKEKRYFRIRNNSSLDSRKFVNGEISISHPIIDELTGNEVRPKISRMISDPWFLKIFYELMKGLGLITFYILIKERVEFYKSYDNPDLPKDIHVEIDNNIQIRFAVDNLDQLAIGDLKLDGYRRHLKPTLQLCIEIDEKDYRDSEKIINEKINVLMHDLELIPFKISHENYLNRTLNLIQRSEYFE